MGYALRILFQNQTYMYIPPLLTVPGQTSLRFYGPVNCTEGMSSASVKHFHTTPVLAKDLVHVSARYKMCILSSTWQMSYIVKSGASLREWPSNKDMIHLNEIHVYTCTVYGVWTRTPTGQSHVTSSPKGNNRSPESDVQMWSLQQSRQITRK